MLLTVVILVFLLKGTFYPNSSSVTIGFENPEEFFFLRELSEVEILQFLLSKAASIWFHILEEKSATLQYNILSWVRRHPYRSVIH